MRINAHLILNELITKKLIFGSQFLDLKVHFSASLNYTRKLLLSAIGIDHFLDTRTVKIQARNFVVVMSLQL